MLNRVSLDEAIQYPSSVCTCVSREKGKMIDVDITLTFFFPQSIDDGNSPVAPFPSLSPSIIDWI